MIEVRPVTSPLVGACLDLFRAASVPCACQYWRFSGTRNEWLLRCAEVPQANEEAFAAECRQGVSPGLVAMEAKEAIGFLRMSPPRVLPRFGALPLYGGTGPSDGTLLLACLLVRPDKRGQGVARALVHAAVDFAKTVGATALEACIRTTLERLPDEQAMMGTAALFPIAGGWVPVRTDGGYAIVQRSL